MTDWHSFWCLPNSVNGRTSVWCRYQTSSIRHLALWTWSWIDIYDRLKSYLCVMQGDNEWQSERQTITEASKFLRQQSPNNTHLNLKRYFVLLWLSRQLCLPQKKEQGDTGAIVLFSSVWWDAWKIDGIMKTASMNDSRPHPIFHFIEMLRLL